MEWIKVFESEDQARTLLRQKKLQRLIIHGRRICLALYNETFYAVDDTCTHNGDSLSKGMINYAGEIICPLHSYRFDLLTGKSCQSSCRDLSTYPLKFDTAGFFVGI